MTYAKCAFAAACLLASAGLAQAQSSPGFATLLASVNGSGTIKFSAGVASSSRPGTGHYVITFTRDVSKCVVGVTPEGTVGGQASVGQPAATPDDVHVYTFSKTGVATNLNFTMIVNCNAITMSP